MAALHFLASYETADSMADPQPTINPRPVDSLLDRRAIVDRMHRARLGCRLADVQLVDLLASDVDFNGR